MAKRHTDPVAPTRQGPSSKYPWDEWVGEEAGVNWELFKGEDYESSDQSMRDLIYRKARDMGKLVSVYQREEGHITIACKGDAPAKPAKKKAAKRKKKADSQ